MQRAAGKQLFSDVSVWGSFGPMRRRRPVRGESAMVNVGPTARMAVVADAGPSSGLSLTIYRIF